MDPHEFLSATRAPDRSRWPDPATLEALVGPRIHTRSAYLWLAHQVELNLPDLNFLLFERHGSWDRRAADPEWAHGGGARPRPKGPEIG